MPKDVMSGGEATALGTPAGQPAAEMQPLDFMLALLRDETANLADRKWAAERAAPYCHPRAAVKAPAEELDGGQEAALEALV